MKSANKLMVFVLLYFIGMIVGGLIGALVPFTTSGESAHSLRLAIFIRHMVSFVFPVITFLYIFHRDNWYNYVHINRIPTGRLLLLSIIFFFLCFPVIQVLHHINSLIPLAPWMETNEEAVKDLINTMLSDKSALGILANISVVAIMPAFTEEFVFRGVLQNELERRWNKPIVAVIVTGFIFSFIHFQFAGFLARFTLGIALGLTYYYTRSIWTCIFLHFINNLLPLIAFVFLDIDTSSTNKIEAANYMSSFVALIGIAITLYFLEKNKITDQHV